MIAEKILIITYYWPPASGPGVQRFLKFAKFLIRNGYDPIILTVKNGGYPSIDESLLNDVPENMKVFKTKTIEPFTIYNALRGKKGKSVEVGMGNIKDPNSGFKKFANYIRSNYFIPDARVGWNKFAYKKAKKIIEEYNIKTVLTTSPPHSTQLIGLKLKKKLSVNWVADLRDPWTTIAYEKYLNRSKRSENKNQKYEEQVVKLCDMLLVVSEGMKEEFSSKYSTTNISVIPNGFDKEDLPSAINSNSSEFFKLCYVGNFKISQNITGLWEALKELDQEIEEFSSLFRLSITGNLNQTIKENIVLNKIEHLLEENPFVKHHEAVKVMFNANTLLLPIPQAENNKLILTGKIFEYLASQNPILGIGPSDGNASKILQKCDRNIMFEYEDSSGIKAFLKKQFNYWKEHQKVSFKHQDKNYLQYSREELAKKLAGVLNSLN